MELQAVLRLSTIEMHPMNQRSASLNLRWLFQKSLQSEEDSGNNADVDSDSTIADASQPAKSDPAVDTDTKTESELQ